MKLTQIIPYITSPCDINFYGDADTISYDGHLTKQILDTLEPYMLEDILTIKAKDNKVIINIDLEQEVK